ncbi:urease accessory protein UreE [Falsiroseomonas sp. CW058]|uniref:urease accessory protein UreE n=1 Tax=Falsiroseomonas sp. CW058 TaxID=3388664 RepID=UPI003D315854
MDESIPRALAVVPAGDWPAEQARDTVTVDFDDRFRRRRLYTAEGGLAFLLDLPEAQVLRDGDGLVLASGGYVRVRAAPEPLVEVTAPTQAHLLRLAWHLGNRHLPAEIDGARILIRHDHVIIRMLEGLGATLRAVDAPFNPEGGAYGEHNRAPSHPHGHHHHDHGHHDHDGPCDHHH